MVAVLGLIPWIVKSTSGGVQTRQSSQSSGRCTLYTAVCLSAALTLGGKAHTGRQTYKHRGLIVNTHSCV